MEPLKLVWNGPFSLATAEGRHDFLPPTDGGIYLWCVGRHPHLRISYVGEASNIQWRLYEHIFWTLGGAYSLYSDNHMVDGAMPDHPAYTPGPKNILDIFLGDFSKYSEMAYSNLLAYSFYWATMIQANRFDRRAVESALIHEFKKRKEPLQNTRTSIAPINCPRRTITSEFKAGSELIAVPQSLEYGEQPC